MATFAERTVTPIETAYNGYRFRSRLEARWAVFFDTLKIDYAYEQEGFDLGAAGWYLPDFFLPSRGDDGAGWWIEIKPGMPDREEIKKCVYLAREEPECRVLMLSGNPSERDYRILFFGKWGFLVQRGLELAYLDTPLLVCTACSQPFICLVKWDDYEREWWHPKCDVCDGFAEDPRPDLRAAYVASKTAQFSGCPLALPFSEKTQYSGDRWIGHVRGEIECDNEFKDRWCRPNRCVSCGREISHKFKTCYNCRGRY